ncbi:surfeit locus protein 6-like protein [Caerostris darwini]|uniref:Surfeit locus protein 6-like protein n=1 Tax=Caerostris darwini TaxID=1538125 RepID=A0AAV4PQ53_9ARAC|nr:surfeit locus protein 6-like protein [Caerostris darwini]
MAHINGENLVQDIAKEDQYLLQLIDTIPANIYFDHDVQEMIKTEKHLTMDRKAEAFKRNSSGLSAQNKHKRARLDPLCQKSISQIHQELSEKKENKRLKGLMLPSASLTRAANIEELQKRLQERIDELHSKRKGNPSNKALKKKLKTKEKKLKHKKVVLSQKAVQIEKTPKKTQTEVKEYNKEGKMIFGKLDFSDDGIKSEKNKGKKIKALLTNAEKKKEKIEKLKSSDPEKAIAVEEKEKWKKAILLSENKKLKDDPELLKKSLKRKEKIKKKSAKEWQERKERVEERQQKRQKKRTKNIREKKKGKMDHKKKLAKKKGRVI